MSSAKIEFAVQMTCDACAKAVKSSLEGIDEIKSVDINLKNGSVVVESTLPAESILKRIQSSGRKAVIKGYGGILAGVAIMDTGSNKVKGVVRFVQETPSTCIIDGTIDGLDPGSHELSVHECGDISNGCQSVGNFFNPNSNKSSERIYGKLGLVETQGDGRSAFRFDDQTLKLSDIIGRALVISDVTTGNRIVCGIIARSAGLFENPKTICACDGISIWNEKVLPKATL